MRPLALAALLLLTPAAPLGMLIYDGPMFPRLKGRLLVGYHGYRASDGAIWVADDRNGHVLRFAADRP